ncbi:peptide chain release factor H [Maribacter sp. SA7]|uniref:peptide chain release factor H n=1 Tax=Maribacter zhoushanensis TaxID=3030012 RepID=UPI0023EB148D|nr:peptide chain release factor H [Maribacter zhoushanensis]MDF4204302.1 peptide chain release factor H [Maribacter zhoushanensis]
MEKIIQITAGRGPAECSWVVAQVLKRFLEETKMKGFKHIIIHREKGNLNGTVQSVTIRLRGEDLEAFLATWLGTIQWIGISIFRKYHKRKNWFIGVFELKQMQTMKLDEKDISFQTMRSTGPGGQNVNKVNSAVRAIHNTTGVQVVAMDSRSQHQNKKLAIARLKEKVNEVNLAQLKNSMIDEWENHMNLQRGNPIRVFKGTDFKHQEEKKGFKPKRQKLKNDLKQQKWDLQ